MLISGIIGEDALGSFILGAPAVPDTDDLAVLLPTSTDVWVGFFTTLPDVEGNGGVESTMDRQPTRAWETYDARVRVSSDSFLFTLTSPETIVGLGVWDAEVGGNLLAIEPAQVYERGNFQDLTLAAGRTIRILSGDLQLTWATDETVIERRTMFTYLNDRLGVTQGRLQPAHHIHSPLDAPEPATATSIQSEPLELEDGQELLVAIDGGATQTVVFDDADFADISAATAAEVAAVIGSSLSGASAADGAGFVVLTTDSTGEDASIRVVGGVANNALQLPTLSTGAQGTWSMVLGDDAPGRTVRLVGGDFVTVTQERDFTIDPVESVRLFGAVRVQSEGLPVGYTWDLTVGVAGVGGVTREVSTVEGIGFEEFLLDDFGVNTSQLSAGEVEFEFTLTLVGPATPVDVVLPAVYVDYTTFADESDTLFLIDRFPAPDQAGTPHTLDRMQVTIARQGGTTVDLTETRVTFEGVLAYDGGSGGFQAGFTGPLSTIDTAGGLSGTDVVIQIDLSGQTYTDEQVIDVRVESDVAGGGAALDETYTFVMADVDQPQVTAAVPQSKQVVRVSFNEPMLMDASAAGALNPDVYDVVTTSSPAVSVVAASVEQISSSVVDVTLDIETTQGAGYDLTVGAAVEDDDGNVMDPAASTASFVGFRPTQPDGRSFNVLDFWPTFNRAEDEAGTKTLRKFSLVMQDIVDLLLCNIDEWTHILDPDFAPEGFLNAMLRDNGNPFEFEDLSEIDKRRLIRLLIDMYKEKGTEVGIINAVRFFVGVDVTLDVVNFQTFWTLGVSELGSDTFVGPNAGDPLWYSFTIVSPVTLTQQQRDRILQIADYMKPAHEHILGVLEPGEVDPLPSFWVLGVDELGVSTLLQ